MTWKTRRCTVVLAATAVAVTVGLGTPASANPLGARAATATSQVSVQPQAYADQLVRAWGRGDRTATDYYATASVAEALFSYADPGGLQWRRVSSQGAVGTTYVTYHDAHGGSLTVGVSDVILGQGGHQAAYTVRFS